MENGGQTIDSTREGGRPLHRTTTTTSSVQKHERTTAGGATHTQNNEDQADAHSTATTVNCARRVEREAQRRRAAPVDHADPLRCAALHHHHTIECSSSSPCCRARAPTRTAPSTHCRHSTARHTAAVALALPDEWADWIWPWLHSDMHTASQSSVRMTTAVQQQQCRCKLKSGPLE